MLLETWRERDTCTSLDRHVNFKHGFFFDLQELEIVMGDQHISFTTSKIGSLIDVNQCKYVLTVAWHTKQEQVVFKGKMGTEIWANFHWKNGI